ncbi:hypothetical protein BsWGS_13506 [Bradybaena similaris]
MGGQSPTVAFTENKPPNTSVSSEPSFELSRMTQIIHQQANTSFGDGELVLLHPTWQYLLLPDPAAEDYLLSVVLLESFDPSPSLLSSTDIFPGHCQHSFMNVDWLISFSGKKLNHCLLV